MQPSPVTHNFSLAIIYVVTYVLFACILFQVKHMICKEASILFVFAHYTKLKTVNTELIKTWWAAKEKWITRLYKQQGTCFWKELTLNKSKLTYDFLWNNWKYLKIPWQLLEKHINHWKSFFIYFSLHTNGPSDMKTEWVSWCYFRSSERMSQSFFKLRVM